jgi:hypothetical protein
MEPDHKLHQKVFARVKERIKGRSEVLGDPACGGHHRLPLFIGARKGRDTEMCCADMLLVSREVPRTVLAIVEVEESGFLPTKICGKVFQAALADHFVHDSEEQPVPFAPKVLFVQVLYGAGFLKDGSRKGEQVVRIEDRIREELPLGSVSKYRLLIVGDESDETGLERVADTVASALP